MNGEDVQQFSVDGFRCELGPSVVENHILMYPVHINNLCIGRVGVVTPGSNDWICRYELEPQTAIRPFVMFDTAMEAAIHLCLHHLNIERRVAAVDLMERQRRDRRKEYKKSLEQMKRTMAKEVQDEQ